MRSENSAQKRYSRTNAKKLFSIWWSQYSLDGRKENDNELGHFVELRRIFNAGRAHEGALQRCMDSLFFWQSIANISANKVCVWQYSSEFTRFSRVHVLQHVSPFGKFNRMVTLDYYYWRCGMRCVRIQIGLLCTHLNNGCSMNYFGNESANFGFGAPASSIQFI